MRLHADLVRDAEGICDVRILADNTRGVFAGLLDDERVHVFDVGDIHALNYPGKEDLLLETTRDQADRDHAYFNFMPGNVHLPPIVFFKKNPHYDHYWVVEYDVCYTGSWGAFFGHFAASDADLLGTTLVRRTDFPDWHQWDGVDIHDESIAERDYVRGFYPVCRFSRRALEQLDGDLRRGVKGHQEALLATLLLAAGQKIEDIGDDGEFVSATNRGRFYRNNPAREWLTPGTFTYRPVRERAGREPDMLWHPVKPSPFPVNYIRMLKAAIRANLPVLARFYDRAVKRR
ncbi:MAG: hypothetical protein ACE363_07545 [Alphaproteobacteria bacterium]